MRKRTILLALAAVAVVATAVAAQVGLRQFKEILTGSEEVPAISTVARGRFEARINQDNTMIEYRLQYSGLEGDATQAHIHFGQHRVNGGISVWLCSNLASPPTPAGVPPCPVRAGTVGGTITASDVVGPAGQGIAAGEFDELLAAIHAGLTYANVHSTKFPGGEVRSQIVPGRSR